MLASALILASLGNPPLEGERLLNELQLRAFRFFWNESNPRTGFTKDRASNFSTDKFDVASIASTGFALAAYPIGVERKWVAKADALARTRLTLNHILSRLDGHRGWYYHFVDWQTGERRWNCELSTIDTSILFAGVIVADRYWNDPAVRSSASRILGKVDWEFMMADTQGKRPHEFFNMGWRPEVGYVTATWAAYNELMMLYIQAYGFSNVTTAGWDKFGRHVYTDRGYTSIEGGPLFMHQMSHVFYDFSNRRDRLGFNYWVATKNATLANRLYCIDNPKGFAGYGPNFWGLSASDAPDGYRANGAPPRTEDDGTITPTAPVASMEFTPRESLAFAEGFLRENPKAWGRYGFSNGVNRARNYIGPDVIGIDLGMMLLGIENYRTGLPHRLSMSHKAIQRGFQKAGLKTAPGSDKGPLQVKASD